MFGNADSDRTKAVREIPQRDEANSFGSQKGIGAARVAVQRAAKD